MEQEHCQDAAAHAKMRFMTATMAAAVSPVCRSSVVAPAHADSVISKASFMRHACCHISMLGQAFNVWDVDSGQTRISTSLLWRRC